MELKIPPPDRVPFGMRAMKTVALADGEFDPTERALMEAAQKLFRVEIDIDTLDPITPEQLAAEITDPHLRWQLCHGMIVMALADGEASTPEFEEVRAFADALEVDSESFETLHKLADHHFMAARIDVARHFFAREKIVERARLDGFGWLAKSVATLARLSEDKALAARYQALETYPENTLGRKYAEFIRSNGFSFPGEKGSPPEPIVLHDMAHTLGGYGTDPKGELQVLGFHAGFRKRHPFTFLLFGLMQFHMGIRVGPLARATTDNLEPELLLQALARGAAMNIDLTALWDPWGVMEHDIDELRRQYDIAPPE